MSAQTFSVQSAGWLRRLTLSVSAAASVARRDLGLSGWLGLALLGLAIALMASAMRTDDEALGLSAEADRLRSESRRAALLRARTPVTGSASAVTRSEPVALPAAPDRRSGSVLPAWVFEQAERQGLRLGAVEYRWGRKAGGVQRVDVSLTANGQYVPTRQWLADTLARLPHAQLLELSFQRPDTSERNLEIRIVIAVHFGVQA
jgi:hypothetical protein